LYCTSPLSINPIIRPLSKTAFVPAKNLRCEVTHIEGRYPSGVEALVAGQYNNYREQANPTPMDYSVSITTLFRQKRGGPHEDEVQQ